MFVDSANNGRITRVTWNEATTVPAYSIKNFAFHPTIKDENKDADLFLEIDEVLGRETVWQERLTPTNCCAPTRAARVVKSPRCKYFRTNTTKSLPGLIPYR